jgi:hypothetical protein
MRDLKFGPIGGLLITVKPMAFIGSAFLWLFLVIIGAGLLNLPLPTAILGGLLCTLVHWVAGLVHHAGHAIFARQTGYPMTGIDLGTHGGLLATSIYPPNEPSLPDSTHLHRALGGPFLSLQLTLITGLLVVVQSQGAQGVWWWVSLFLLVDNFFTFTLQALIPFGFNDGEVLWRVLRKGDRR